MREFINHKIFQLLSELSEQLQIQTFVVGGFVRNCFLEQKNKFKDIDIVCNKNAIELAKKMSNKLNLKDIVIYKNFGTALVKYKQIQIEFISARKEYYDPSSRKPTIKHGSMEDDQKRRDFTINAMSISLNKKTFGNLIDPFNGQEDLENKIIRTPLEPDKTFFDDPLRMFRAIRFSNQLDFKIEERTLKSIKINSERISILSKERILDEFEKILLCEKPSYGLKLLFETGIIKKYFYELHELHGVEKKHNHSHKDNFFHTLEVVDNVRKKSKNIWLIWAALLHDIAKPKTKKYNQKEGWTFHGHEYLGAKMVPRIFKRLKLPLNENMKYVQKLVLLHLRLIPLTKKSVTDSAFRRIVFEAGNDIEDLYILCEADITSKNEEKVKKYLKNLSYVKNKIEEIEEKDKLRNFQPPVDGEMIMKTFNLKPSKLVGEIKIKIREAILNGEIKNHKKEAQEYMIKIGRELNLTT